MKSQVNDAASVSAWMSPSLYIGDLDPNVSEQDLFEIFVQFGSLESAKVCRNWDTGEPLGYGFLNFTNIQDAETALKIYNFRPVKGKPCRLMWSTKRSVAAVNEESAANVFVKGLADHVDNEILFDHFSNCGTVLSARVATKKNGSSLGYGYVSFASDEAAEAAIVSMNNSYLCGLKISVEMFVEKSRRNLKPWTNVHISGIPPNWTKSTLSQRFSCFGEIKSSVIMTDDSGFSRGFGFVDFVEHYSAKKAVEESNLQKNGKFNESMVGMKMNPIFSVALHVTPANRKERGPMKRIPRAGERSPSSVASTTCSNARTSPIGFNHSQFPDFWLQPGSNRRDSDFTLEPLLFDNELFGNDQHQQQMSYFDQTTFQTPNVNRKLRRKPFSDPVRNEIGADFRQGSSLGGYKPEVNIDLLTMDLESSLFTNNWINDGEVENFASDRYM